MRRYWQYYKIHSHIENKLAINSYYTRYGFRKEMSYPINKQKKKNFFPYLIPFKRCCKDFLRIHSYENMYYIGEERSKRSNGTPLYNLYIHTRKRRQNIFRNLFSKHTYVTYRDFAEIEDINEIYVFFS